MNQKMTRLIIDLRENDNAQTIGIQWISADGRLQSMWFNELSEAYKQEDTIRGLKVRYSMLLRINHNNIVEAEQ